MAGVLYFGDVDENPIIGRFNDTDEVNFDPQSDSVYMWHEMEEIGEDEEEKSEKDKEGSEFWKRRNRRRFLRKWAGKRKLQICDLKKKQPVQQATNSSVNLPPMRFEGTKIDGISSGSKYVLLQVLKPGDSRAAEISMEEHNAAGGGAIVKVIPVGDWYSFQKPSRMKSDVSLDKIDGDFDHQERLKRKKRSLLKQIKKGSIFFIF